MLLGLDLIAAHMVGDFLLQSEGIAESKLGSVRARLIHVLFYAASFVPIVWLYGGHRWIFLALIAATHFVIDSRRWTKSSWAPGPILVDQTLHVVTLAVLARLLGA